VSRKKGGNGHDEDLPAVVPPKDRVDTLDQPSAGEGSKQAGEETGLEPVPAATELEALRRERDELREALLRRRADFENYRRRVERDRAVAAEEAAAVIFGQLVNTVDNLERALASSETDEGLRRGVELTYRELVSFLESQNVTAVDPGGERFDPALHQALLHEPSEGFEPGTVAQVLRKGYRYKDRLLRPALVKVARGPEDRDEARDGGEGLQ
jgi:molecular chaperone GrpE